MKAVVYTRYGLTDQLRLTDLPVPTPRAGEVRVRVRAVSLNLSDWEALRGSPGYARLNGLRRPRRQVLGSDIAGTVDAVGPGVTRFAAGDDVYGDILSYLGGFAEYVCVPEKVLEPLPEGMSHEEASAIPQAGMIALQGIVARGRVRAGERVLINGAGGGSGSYAIQLAKLYGAEVTGVDNAGKLEFMRSMGADHVLDYRQTDYTATGDRYDLILDLVAYRSVAACARALAPGGRYFMVGGPVSTLLRVLVFGPLRGRIRVLAVQLGARHVGPLVELIRDGKVATVIDRRFPLAEVPDALRYVGEGHAKGKVVVTID
ncbi:NAD(P)-dependent alcohol dehydrogenase [Luedemannella flava]|uniref:NAD(P)-dependent alcohol dehydrogenase n=1 Tax=Luedemannella flava TaxID=349316 RepID=A0ABN2LVK1_9ACTN